MPREFKGSKALKVKRTAVSLPGIPCGLLLTVVPELFYTVLARVFCEHESCIALVCIYLHVCATHFMRQCLSLVPGAGQVG